MGKCKKTRCPMQYDKVDENCDIKDCPYRMEQLESLEKCFFNGAAEMFLME